MRLIEYVEDLQRNGDFWFTKDQAKKVLGISDQTLRKAMDRLISKKRIKVLKSGFVVIVPMEYRDWGILPASWFIDPLMKHLKRPYYISLLTAAQYHGAAHQKPQRFQVITEKFLKPIKAGRVQIYFYTCKQIVNSMIKPLQVETGRAKISTPEATALDLCKYYKHAGYWDNVATVLSELQEEMDPNQLFKLAVSGLYETPVIQRLGYLLSLKEVEGAKLAQELRPLIAKQKARWILLQSGDTGNIIERDHFWKVKVNQAIEVDV